MSRKMFEDDRRVLSWADDRAPERVVDKAPGWADDRALSLIDDDYFSRYVANLIPCCFFHSDSSNIAL